MPLLQFFYSPKTIHDPYGMRGRVGSDVSREYVQGTAGSYFPPLLDTRRPHADRSARGTLSNREVSLIHREYLLYAKQDRTPIYATFNNLVNFHRIRAFGYIEK